MAKANWKSVTIREMDAKDDLRNWTLNFVIRLGMEMSVKKKGFVVAD